MIDWGWRLYEPASTYIRIVPGRPPALVPKTVSACPPSWGRFFRGSAQSLAKT